MPSQPYRKRLTAWGRSPLVEGFEVKTEDLAQGTLGAALCRGLGRSYGDLSLPARKDDVVVDTTLADRIIECSDRNEPELFTTD
jgi:decaprenylphospho-beta-D-ribofuranose 2-oxidase